MMALAVAAGLLALVGAVAGLVVYFGRQSREIERKLGEARGEIESLREQLEKRVRELEALRADLVRSLDPVPTLDELDRVSGSAAGEAARAGAAAAIRVP